MKITNRTYALIAGISLIIMALAAGFSYGYVFGNLMADGNPGTTFQNIKATLPLFKSGIAGWILILVSDVLVAWALYRYFFRVNQKLSATTAVFRMAYAAFLGLAIYHLFAVLPLMQTNGFKVQNVHHHLETFKQIWSAGLILFGLHLFGLGVLAFKARFVPRIWGILLFFAGLCYTLIHAAKILFPTYVIQIEQVEAIMSAPMAIAEIGFGLWLLIRGGLRE